METFFRVLFLFLIILLFVIVSEANSIGCFMFGCAIGLNFYLLEHYGR